MAIICMGSIDDRCGGVVIMTSHQLKQHTLQFCIVFAAFSAGIVFDRTGGFDDLSHWVEDESGINLPWVDKGRGWKLW